MIVMSASLSVIFSFVVNFRVLTLKLDVVVIVLFRFNFVCQGQLRLVVLFIDVSYLRLCDCVI